MRTLRITLNERNFNRASAAHTINVNKVYLFCIRYIWFGEKNVDIEQVARIMHEPKAVACQPLGMKPHEHVDPMQPDELPLIHYVQYLEKK